MLNCLFFSFIAGLLKPYLAKYQTDQPMIPFLAKDLEAMYKSLMQLILKTQSFDDCSGNDLLCVDLSNKSNYLKPKDIHLGFETAKVLQDLIVKLIITAPSAKAFRQECLQMIIDLLQKLLQKSPLSSPIVARSTAINPLCIFSSPKDTLRSKMNPPPPTSSPFSKDHHIYHIRKSLGVIHRGSVSKSQRNQCF